MDRDKIMDAMNHIDPALVEAADLPAKRPKRWKRPALIAACLCLVLAGTALAAELAGVSLSDFYEEPATLAYPGGEKEIISEVFDIRASGVRRFPLSDLSQEVLDLAADGMRPHNETSFYSKSELEEFLGVKLADNAALDGLMQGPLGVYSEGLLRKYRWSVDTFSFSDGAPYNIWAAMYYECQERFVTVEDGDGVLQSYAPSASLWVSAQIYTERWNTGESDDEITSSFRASFENGTPLAREDYVTPGGVAIPVVRYGGTTTLGTGLEREFWSYQAYFVLDGILYEVSASSDSSEEKAAALLAQVLDGYDGAICAEYRQK